MIHIRNNYTNNLVFVETLPSGYTLNLKHNVTKEEYNLTLINELTINTQSNIYINNMNAGEYTYKLISDNYTYETGLCKIASDILTVIKTHKKTNIGFKTKKTNG